MADNFYSSYKGAGGGGSDPNAIDGLTGDVTATGPGTVAATISNLAVTTGKIANNAVTSAKVDSSVEITANKGIANGYASLDSGGKVPAAQLPNSVMEYLGTWAASTNTPTLVDGVGNAGDVYIASDAGTVNFGSGPITFAAGDWVIYSGTVWQKSINSNAVASVNGMTGAVTINAINQLTGDVTAGPASGSASAAATIANLAVTNAKIANSTIDLTTKVTGVLPVANGGAGTQNKETFTLNSTDITHQYIDLAHVAVTGSIFFEVQGGGLQLEGASYDYSVSYTGGSGGNTRISFLNGLATGGVSALVASDVVQVSYTY